MHARCMLGATSWVHALSPHDEQLHAELSTPHRGWAWGSGCWMLRVHAHARCMPACPPSASCMLACMRMFWVHLLLQNNGSVEGVMNVA